MKEPDARWAGELLTPMSDGELAVWAGDVLRVIAERGESIDAVESLLEALPHREQWPRGRDLFVELRQRTLRAEQSDRCAELELLLLAENVAKTVYNLSGGAAPFDEDCASAIAVSARRHWATSDVSPLREELAVLLGLTSESS